MENDRFKISLRAARENAGIRTQSEAASLIGVHCNTISNWENGVSLPNIRYINDIERVYKIKYDRIKFTS